MVFNDSANENPESASHEVAKLSDRVEALRQTTEAELLIDLDSDTKHCPRIDGRV